MNKSVTKRIKITKGGKVVRRTMGVNHFRTRKSTNNIRQKRKTQGLGVSNRSIHEYANR